MTQGLLSRTFLHLSYKAKAEQKRVCNNSLLLDSRNDDQVKVASVCDLTEYRYKFLSYIELSYKRQRLCQRLCQVFQKIEEDYTSLFFF